MSRNEQYQIDEFLITIDSGSFLVEVTNADAREPSIGFESIPAWIFTSRYAIWLTAGDAPIRIRAMMGEQIKQQLLKRFPQIVPA